MRVINAVEVAFESLFNFILGLPNILFVAAGTTDAIDQVVAFACSCVSGSVDQTCVMAGDLARFV